MIGFLVMALMIFYLAPTLIAMKNTRRDMASIIIINIFLGWTMIGWVLTLAWALMPPKYER